MHSLKSGFFLFRIRLYYSIYTYYTYMQHSRTSLDSIKMVLCRDNWILLDICVTVAVTANTIFRTFEKSISAPKTSGAAIPPRECEELDDDVDLRQTNLTVPACSGLQYCKQCVGVQTKVITYPYHRYLDFIRISYSYRVVRFFSPFSLTFLSVPLFSPPSSPRHFLSHFVRRTYPRFYLLILGFYSMFAGEING